MTERLLYCAALSIVLGFIAYLDGDRAKLVAMLLYSGIGSLLLGYGFPVIATIGAAIKRGRYKHVIFGGMLVIILMSYWNQILNEVYKADLIYEWKKEVPPKKKDLKEGPKWNCNKFEGERHKSCSSDLAYARSSANSQNVEIKKENAEKEIKIKEIEKRNAELKPDYSQAWLIFWAGAAFSVFLSTIQILFIGELVKQLHIVWGLYRISQRTKRAKIKADNDFKTVWDLMSEVEKIFYLERKYEREDPSSTVDQIMVQIGKDLKRSKSNVYNIRARNGIPIKAGK